MRKEIFKFLEKNGYTPETDGQVIGFRQDEAALIIAPQEGNNYIRICMGTDLSDIEQFDLTATLESINEVNSKTFVKAVLNGRILECSAEFQCDSISEFEKYFQQYVGGVIVSFVRVAQAQREHRELTEQRDQTETVYDKIHYHVTYWAIPMVIRQISRLQDKTAMKLDNKRTLMIGLLPELTREEVWAFPWDDLKITEREIEDGKRLMIYEFPAPRRRPQAKFAAVLMDAERIPIDYITLERACESEDNEIEMKTPELNTNILWMLGTVITREDNAAHYNYGLMRGEPTLENFIETAKAIFDTPKEERQSYTRKGV